MSTDKASLLSLSLSLYISLEIRLQIYTLLLAPPPYSKHFPHQPPIRAASSAPTASSTSRPRRSSTQTASSPAPPCCPPSFSPPAALLRPRPQPSALRRIRRFHLVLRLDCDTPCSRTAFAAAFTGLDELVVHVVQAVFLGGGCANMRVLEGVTGVRRVTRPGQHHGLRGPCPLA
ncbi:Uncharacterized protein TPAR_04771 [Tolypocladium paradoxum]|uniref:Uncharacterized protein n=1 Tax=Tolypocladium paradoxum TaxID=94208 RepID=A0A2S4KXW5_9HYPO|nr:Uncharacterized protein TPAR_04771 [Tolypocladium paradoxum]